MLENGVLITNDVLIFAVVAGIAFFGMYAQKHFKWAKSLSSMGVSILTALLVVSLHIIPTESSSYNLIMGNLMPVAIPMILIKANAKRIVKDTGRAFILMNIACVGATIGGILVGFVFGKLGVFSQADLPGYVAMEVGVCTGGVVNQVAMAESFGLSGDVFTAASVGSNLVATIYILFLVALPNFKFIKNHFKHPHIDEAERLEMGQLDTAAIQAEAAKGEEKFSLQGLAKLVTYSVGLYGITQILIGLIAKLGLPSVLDQLFTNKFLILTLLSLIITTVFPKLSNSLAFGEDIGTYFLFLYLTCMGTGATVMEVIKYAPMLVLAECIVGICITLLTLSAAKLLKIDVEEGIIAMLASYGGPSTPVGYCGAKGWKRLVLPGILLGIYGYVVGNFFGIIAGNIFV